MGVWGAWDDTNDLSRDAYLLLQEKLGLGKWEGKAEESDFSPFGTNAVENISSADYGDSAEESRESRCRALLLQHPRLFYDCLSDTIKILEGEGLSERDSMSRTVGLALEVYHLYNREAPAMSGKIDPNFPPSLRLKCADYIRKMSHPAEILAGGWACPAERLSALEAELRIFQ